MKVKVDFWRLLHLAILVVLTYVFGLYLAQQWDLSSLSAYGMSCFAVCQCSNVLCQLLAPAPIQHVASLSETRAAKHQKKK